MKAAVRVWLRKHLLVQQCNLPHGLRRADSGQELLVGPLVIREHAHVAMGQKIQEVPGGALRRP